jgi:hypothetical protein
MKFILHRLTPSEISAGSLFLGKGDGMLKFFSQFTGPFPIVTKWQVLHERRVGKEYIWMGYEIMRNFNPYDTIKISKKGNSVHIEKN